MNEHVVSIMPVRELVVGHNIGGSCVSYDMLRANDFKGEMKVVQYLRQPCRACQSQQHTATSHMNSSVALVFKLSCQPLASETKANHVKRIILGVTDGATAHIFAEDHPVSTRMAEIIR